MVEGEARCRVTGFFGGERFMSPGEAAWFFRAMMKYGGPEAAPVLNLGSSTREFRAIVHPHIDRELFGPLKQEGVHVFHSDLKAADGVDLVGDVLDPGMQAKYRALGVNSVLCNNMLEHVTDIREMCRALGDICPSGGLLLLSAPFAYPHHPDPIDNGFRPGLQDLKDLMAPFGFRLLEGDVLDFGNYAQALISKPKLLLRDLYLVFSGIAKREKWRVLLGNYRFLLRQYKVVCAVFQREKTGTVSPLSVARGDE